MLSPVVAVAVVLACVVAGSTQTAWALTPEEKDQAWANFNKFCSGNKTLTLDQFQRFIDLNAEANIGEAQRIQSNKAYENAFSDMDADANNKVTWGEYLKYEREQRS